LIRIKKLHVRYKYVEAVKDVTLEIPDGKITCIIGPNGAGKTSLLRSISKIIEFDGKIYLDGIEVSKTPLKTISKILSYSTSVYLPDLLSLKVIDALKIARYPVSKRFFETREDFETIFKIASEFKINNFLEKKLSELSSGELQRVILAMAIIKNPKYLLLDEPDSHVDVSNKAELINILRKLARTKTVILTTHDVLFASIVGDYFVLMNNGKVLFVGDKQRFFENKKVLEETYGIEFYEVKLGSTFIMIPLYVSKKDMKSQQY